MSKPGLTKKQIEQLNEIQRNVVYNLSKIEDNVRDVVADAIDNLYIQIQDAYYDELYDALSNEPKIKKFAKKHNLEVERMIYEYIDDNVHGYATELTDIHSI